MVYVEKKRLKGKDYLYLVKIVRVGKGLKKFREYLGAGLSDRELERLRKKKLGSLEAKAEAFMKSQDPLLGILSPHEVEELDHIRKEYSTRKMSPPQLQKYLDWFVTSFTYNSNSIEGSTLTLQETSLVLFDKITPPEKPIKDVKEAENHKKAFEHVLTYDGPITQAFVTRIHQILFDDTLEEAGAFRNLQVYIRGTQFLPAKPEQVEKEFNQLVKWIKKAEKRYHPIVITAYTHAMFESIHPFIDGNGRTGRLLLNYQLKKHGYPFIDIKQERKLDYYKALQAFNQGDLKLLIHLIIEYLKESLRVQKH